MIAKNAKTILFASLIAAMILPLGGMNYAIAQEVNPDERATFNADLLRAHLAEEQDRIKSDKSDKQAIKKLERLDKFGQLIDLKEAILNENNPIQIKKLESQAQKIIADIQNSIEDSEVVQGVSKESRIQTVSHTHNVSFGLTKTRSADCDNPNTQFAHPSASGTSSASSTTMDYFADYPATVATGVVGNCTSYDDISAYYQLVDSNTTCYVFTFPASGNWSNITCNNINWNQIVLVTTNAFYNGGQQFGSGWTIMFT